MRLRGCGASVRVCPVPPRLPSVVGLRPPTAVSHGGMMESKGYTRAHETIWTTIGRVWCGRTASLALCALALLCVFAGNGLLPMVAQDARLGNFFSSAAGVGLEGLPDKELRLARGADASKEKVYQYAPNPIQWIDPLGLLVRQQQELFRD